MFYNNVDSMRQGLLRYRRRFASRFSQNDGTIVYRRKPTSPPIKLSPEERDYLVGQFDRHMGWAIGGVFIGALLALAIAVLLSDVLKMNINTPTTLLIVATIPAPAIAIGIWAWNAPTRLLVGRTATDA